MGEGRYPTEPSWLSRHSGEAMFLVGCAMVFTGLLFREGATAVTTAFLGCGLMLVGSLLPRLTGTIKVTPGSIELALAERLEATRREVEARAPDLEEEALARAVEELLPRLTAGHVEPFQSTAAPSVEREASPGRRPSAPRAAPVSLDGEPTGRDLRSEPRRRSLPRLATAGATAVALVVGGIAFGGLVLTTPAPGPADDASQGDGQASADGDGQASADSDGQASAGGDGRPEGEPDDVGQGVAPPADPGRPDPDPSPAPADDEPGPTDDPAPPTDDGTSPTGGGPGDEDESGQDAGTAGGIVWAVTFGALLVAGWSIRRYLVARRSAPERSLSLTEEPAQAFARRIVDELVGAGAHDGHDASRDGPPGS
jgi:hypothetical protein